MATPRGGGAPRAYARGGFRGGRGGWAEAPRRDSDPTSAPGVDSSPPAPSFGSNGVLHQPTPPQTASPQPTPAQHTLPQPAPQQPKTDEGERPVKRTRFDFGEDIIVLIGHEEKRYCVHKRIICEASPFFRAASDGKWKEGDEGVVKLRGVDPATFDVYICWLYTNELDVVSGITDKEIPAVKYDKVKVSDIFFKSFTRLMNAFALGDMLLDDCFKNTVVDEYVLLSKQTDTVPSDHTLTALWNTVPQRSSLVKAVVDICAVGMSLSSLEEMVDRLPSGFVIELAKSHHRDRGLALLARGIFNRNRCFYHEHKDGKGKTQCCST